MPRSGTLLIETERAVLWLETVHGSWRYGEMVSSRMPEDQYKQIILTHWNAGVFRSTSLPQVLPELVIYSLLYEEVLIREEDLLTNRAITRLQPTCTASIETEPPSTPSTGNVSGSDGVRVPAT